MEIGGHLRIIEGLKFVPLEARAMGYNLVQIMLSEELEWNPIQVEESAALEYRKTMFGIRTVVHLPFTINPCEEAPRKRQFARVIFRRFTKVAMNLGASAVVLHPGFKKEQSEEDALVNTLLFFDDLLKEDLKMKVYLETDTGSKNESKVGSLEFIKKVVAQLRTEEVKMCLDTAHLYARGVDLWDSRVLDGVLQEYGDLVELVHLNVPDANVLLGGHLDRHNTPFQDCQRDSVDLIRSMLRWPVVLERRSLAIQEMDLKFIRNLFGKIDQIGH